MIPGGGEYAYGPPVQDRSPGYQGIGTYLGFVTAPTSRHVDEEHPRPSSELQAPGVELWTIPEFSTVRDAEPAFGSAGVVTPATATAAEPVATLLVAKTCEQRVAATVRPNMVDGTTRVANDRRGRGSVKPHWHAPSRIMVPLRATWREKNLLLKPRPRRSPTMRARLAWCDAVSAAAPFPILRGLTSCFRHAHHAVANVVVRRCE